MPVMELSKGLSLPHSFAECEGVEEESALGNPHQGGSTMKRVSECKRVLVTEKLLEFGFKLDVDSDEGKVRQVIDGIDGGQVNFYEVSSDSMSETSSIDSSVSACLYVSDTASLMVPDSFDGLKPLFGDNEGVPPASPSVNFSKNCLGALDGTYVSVTVPEVDKPRYRTRKNDIAINVLGVCSQDMQFIFVLLGWEGSAANSRVLRDAVSRRHDLKVPRGFYYLVDAGYPNGEGFLAPYRGQRYHLND